MGAMEYVQHGMGTGMSLPPPGVVEMRRAVSPSMTCRCTHKRTVGTCTGLFLPSFPRRIRRYRSREQATRAAQRDQKQAEMPDQVAEGAARAGHCVRGAPCEEIWARTSSRQNGAAPFHHSLFANLMSGRCSDSCEPRIYESFTI